MQEGRADSLLNMPEAPFCASALASAAMELSPHCLPILAEFERTMAIAWIFGKDILKQASTPEQDMIQLKHQSKKRLHEWIVMGASELAPDHPLIDLLGRDYLKDYIKKVKASLPRHIALLPKTDQATLKKMEKELLHRLDQLNRQLQ